MGDIPDTPMATPLPIVELIADFAPLVKKLQQEYAATQNHSDVAKRAIKMLEHIGNSPNRRAEVEELQEQVKAQETALQHLYQQLDESRKVSLALATRSAEHPHSHSSPNSKIPDPEKFTGEKRDKLKSFLVQLRLKAATLSDEQARLRYAVSVLDGPALDQLIPHVKNETVDLTNLQALIDILEAAFGDPDKQGTAARKLSSLRQAGRDFATYYAEFSKYAAELDWNEPAKLAALKSGLSYELKQDLIPLEDEPETITALVKICQKLDNRRRALQFEIRKPSSSNTTAPRTTTSTFNTFSKAPTPTVNSSNSANSTKPASTATGTHPGPMDLSSNRKKLSPEERVRRILEGLCLYCGGVGHMAKDCPLAKEKENQKKMRLHEAQMCKVDGGNASSGNVGDESKN